jgi:hypothetical protein
VQILAISVRRGGFASMALRFDKVQLISIRDKLGERSSSNESKYERIVGAYNHRADQRK